jgi:2',3'-cyclic-nucleotide 2'-phosphodiesterase (5'-nucleotidase family)
VRGNHETRGKFARDLKSYLALPGGRFYYAFSHGGVRFVVLDTGEDKEDTHWAYSGLTSFEAYRQAQAAWLKQEVQTPEFKNARFRILVAHMPFFGNERTRASGAGQASCRENFGPILNEAGIDLHIAGHTHRVDWVAPADGANRFPIVVGGGSAAGTNTLTRVTVSGDALAIVQTTDEGKVVGVHKVNRR